jgi:hypothetical protein
LTYAGHEANGQTFDILPDDDSWGTDIHTVRFPERPSAVSAALNTAERATSDQLRNAFLRGLQLEDMSKVYEYHLPDDEDPGTLNSLQPVEEEQGRQFEEFVEQGDIEQAQQAIPVCFRPQYHDLAASPTSTSPIKADSVY